jgi:hypothetical protein
MRARDAMTTNKSTKTTAALLVLAALLLVPALDAAAQDLPDREAVERALIGYHDLADKKTLSSLGLGVDLVLQKIVTKPSQRALARTRAISALQHFPSAATRAVLLAYSPMTGVLQLQA